MQDGWAGGGGVSVSQGGSLAKRKRRESLRLCSYAEDVELGLGDLLVARSTSHGAPLVPLDGAAFVATSSSSPRCRSSSALVAVAEARSLGVAAEIQGCKVQSPVVGEVLDVFGRRASFLTSR